MIVGNRVPRDFFVTSGTGQSDITTHAGSYHLALRAAGIEMANIITYSSILPGSALEIDQPKSITHGCVMETIMGVGSCVRGESVTAGVIFGWLYDRLGQRYGGLVCEYGGPLPEQKAKTHLREMLAELHQNGYQQFDLREGLCMTQTSTPTKKFGTALVALCFVSYDIPLASA